MAGADDREPAGADLEALYRAEAAAPLPPGCEARILSAVLARLPAPAVPTRQPRRPVRTAAALALLVVVGASAGAAIHGVVVDEPPPLVGASSIRVAQPAGPSVPAPSPSRPPAAPPRAPAASRPAPAPRPASSPTGEALLIEQARAALHRGLTAEALVTLMSHERRFPAGRLAEERDLLLIEAYLAAGDRRLAADRLERYRRAHPGGALHRRADHAAARLRSER